jgi:hypothetical protein
VEELVLGGVAAVECFVAEFLLIFELFEQYIDPSVDSILEYCHFPEPASRIAIANDGFGSFNDISHLEHADIANLSKGFSTRTQANGRINFGLERIKLLKSVVDWTQVLHLSMELRIKSPSTLRSRKRPSVARCTSTRTKIRTSSLRQQHRPSSRKSGDLGKKAS